MVYIGDTDYAPYGERTPVEINERSHRITRHLAGRGARIVVVACNTATVQGIDALRREWPSLSFVGVEPGVKPAAAQSRTRRIAVMTTSSTASSARLRALIATHAAGVHVHVQACPGLASAIERGVLGGPELDRVLAPHCAAVRAADVDTVVLGCTHYPFVAEAIRGLLGDEVSLIDTATAVAERVAFLWSGEGAPAGPTRLEVFSTGATASMQALLKRCAGCDNASVSTLAL